MVILTKEYFDDCNKSKWREMVCSQCGQVYITEWLSDMWWGCDKCGSREPLEVAREFNETL